MANTQQQGQGPAPRHPPCAACKYQRKKCLEKCELAPYFPPSRYEEFRAAYKIYGVSNIQKMLAVVPPDQRQIAADSLITEGTARMNDPVHGSLGIIRDLKEQIESHRLQLEALNQQLAFYKETEIQSDLMTKQSIQEDGQSVYLGVPVPLFPHAPPEVMAEMRRYEQGYIYYSNLEDVEDQEEHFDINLIKPVFESDLKRNAKSCFSGPGESSAAAAAAASAATASAASDSKDKGNQSMGV